MQLALVTLAIGQPALKIFQISSQYMQKYAQFYNLDFVPILENKVNQYSNHLEKFQIKELLERYDRVLYLDADILIQPDCPNLFEIVPSTHIGAVYDNVNNDPKCGNRIKEIANIQALYGHINWTTEYINTGVLVLSKQHKIIFSQPELRNKMSSSYKDQTLINYMIQKNQFPIYKLDSKFNGMEINGYSSRKNSKTGKRFPYSKHQAHIMHFAHEGIKHKQMMDYVPILNAKLKSKQINSPEIQIINEQNELKPLQINEQNLIQIGAKDIKVFYDISELGWAQYLAAHLLWLKEQGQNTGIICSKAREVLYRNCTDLILPIPEKFLHLYGHLPSDGNHLYDPKTNQRIKNQHSLSDPFREAYPDLNIITEYTKFENQRIFAPYEHSELAEKEARLISHGSPVILVFPRNRISKFSARNIPLNSWINIISNLCNQFPNHKIISIGSKDGAYNINMPRHNNYVDLVHYDDDKTLDILVAFCNTKIATMTVGNQSGTVKIALLCGTPTYIFGHEKNRHIVDENWAKTTSRFWVTVSTPNGFQIPNLNSMINEIIVFGKEICSKRGIKP